jgi:hypothetical protein
MMLVDKQQIYTDFEQNKKYKRFLWSMRNSLQEKKGARSGITACIYITIYGDGEPNH